MACADDTRINILGCSVQAIEKNTEALVVATKEPLRRCFHLIVVRRFEYASDPESYTSGSVATELD